MIEFLSQQYQILDICAPPSHQPQHEELWDSEEIINDAVYIPSWWHDAITGVGQQFENTKEVKLVLISYLIAKKFVYKKMVIVECKHKKDKCGIWRLHAFPMTHITTFAIKIFIEVYTCYTRMGTDGHKKVSQK